MAGKLVAFEGIDGSGKSTCLASVADALRARGLKVYKTREPSGGPVGTMLRQRLATDEPASPFRWLEMELLLAADRAWHVEHELLPALEVHDVVLCDRYVASGKVYGAACLARGASENLLDTRQSVSQILDAFPEADATIFLACPVDVAQERVRARGGDLSRYDRDPEILARIAKGYDDLRCEDEMVYDDSGWRVVDAGAGRSPEAVAADALAHILRALG